MTLVNSSIPGTDKKLFRGSKTNEQKQLSNWRYPYENERLNPSIWDSTKSDKSRIREVFQSSSSNDLSLYFTKLGYIINSLTFFRDVAAEHSLDYFPVEIIRLFSDVVSPLLTDDRYHMEEGNSIMEHVIQSFKAIEKVGFISKEIINGIQVFNIYLDNATYDDGLMDNLLDIEISLIEKYSNVDLSFNYLTSHYVKKNNQFNSEENLIYRK